MSGLLDPKDHVRSVILYVRPRAAGGRGGETGDTLARVKATTYFEAMRHRRDRAMIRQEWIERAIRAPLREQVQGDGRIRRWVQILEADGRYLRVILLPDGETVHNAFFDRRFIP